MSTLSVGGKDARDLLQRLTTNEVLKRNVGDVFANVFTSEKGRVLELSTMVVREDDVLVLGQVPAAALASWIRKMTFREKVQVCDLALQVVTSFDAPVENAVFNFAGKLAGISGHHGLVNASVVVSPHFAFEHWRIEHGVPWLGKDIGDENNPHEAGLADAISWDKGCYIGQEVVARLDTYDKVQRHLRSLKLSVMVAPGTRLKNGDNDVGVITSVDGLRALGYVHRKADGVAMLSAGEAQVTVVERAVP